MFSIKEIIKKYLLILLIFKNADQVNVMAMSRGRKRSSRGSRNSSAGTPSKRGRRTSGSVDVPLISAPEPVPPPRIEVEKPDANLCLKVTNLKKKDIFVLID